MWISLPKIVVRPGLTSRRFQIFKNETMNRIFNKKIITTDPTVRDADFYAAKLKKKTKK